MTFSTPGARLHALIGDAVLDPPFHLLERLEQALADGGVPEATPALIGHLRLMQHGEDGPAVLWEEDGMRPGRRGELARAGRSLRALGTVMQLLHAAQQTRLHGGPGQELGDRMEDGLLLAGRELVQSMEDALGGGR